MTQNRFTVHDPFQHPDPKLGRVLLISVGLHLIVVILALFDLLPHGKPPQRPTYFVDLTQMPVASPQAGRPDARPEVKKAAKAPEPARPKVQKSAPPPKAETVKRAETKKTPPAAKPKPQPKPQVDSYQSKTLSAIEKMRQKQQREAEIESLQQKIAALSDTRQAAATRGDLGMPNGTGTEAGASQEAYLHDLLKANWSVSQYQLTGLDLEARLKITYDAEGNLLDYSFVKESSDRIFDDSLKKAILKANPLPFTPQKRWEVTVTFNLKELMNR